MHAGGPRLVRVDFGIGYFPTHDADRPRARSPGWLEERGQESLFFAEHTHIPASRETPVPGGGELPRKYWHTLRPVRRADRGRRGDHAACASAAASAWSSSATRSPPPKRSRRVDHLSGGRFEFGVGAGWNREEMAQPRHRSAHADGLMRERVEAMKAIWTQDEASYHGEFVNFDRIWSWPKPAQRPHPPVLVGGNGPTVLDRVLAFGDGWFPNYDPAQRARPDRRSCARAPSARSTCMVMGMPADPAVLERLRAQAGCRRVVHWLPSGGRSVVEPALERWEAAIAELTGEGDRGRGARSASPPRGVARLATADAARPAAPRPDRLRARRRHRSTASSTPSRSGRPRCGGSPTSPRTRAVALLVDHYDDGLGRLVVGARRRARRACSSPTTRRRGARWRCCRRATRSSAPSAPCWRSTSSAGAAGQPRSPARAVKPEALDLRADRRALALNGLGDDDEAESFERALFRPGLEGAALGQRRALEGHGEAGRRPLQADREVPAR